MLAETRNLLSVRCCLAIAKRHGNRKERVDRSMFPNRTAQGPLTDLPDYSYVDGRGFGEPSLGQKKRYIRNIEFAKTIVKNIKMYEQAKQLVPDKK